VEVETKSEINPEKASRVQDGSEILTIVDLATCMRNMKKKLSIYIVKDMSPNFVIVI